MNRRSARNRHRPRASQSHETARVIWHSPDHIERTVTIGPDTYNFHRAIRPPVPIIERIGRALDGMTVTAVDVKNGTVTFL